MLARRRSARRRTADLRAGSRGSVFLGRFLGWLAALIVTAGAARAADPPADRLRLVPGPDVISVVRGDRTILDYRYRPNPLKPYVKRFFTPGGIEVLRDSPHDHVHHHALMLALGAEGVDFWGETPECGLEEHVALERRGVTRKGDITRASFTQKLRWTARDGTPILAEARKLTVIDDPAAKASLLTWRSSLRSASVKGSASLWGRHYFGLGLRFLESMDSGGEFIGPGRAGGETVRGTEKLHRAAWCAYSAKAGSRPVTVAVFSHPENVPATTWFTMTAPFAYISATLDLERKTLELAGDARLRLVWGVALLDGAASEARVEALYRRWRELTPGPAKGDGEVRPRQR